MKFTVHEKQMKVIQGASYDLSKYTEGVDYKRQKTGFGSRVVFRADILGSSEAQVALKSESSDLNAVKSDLNELSDVLSEQEIVITVVDPSLVEHKQDKSPIIILRDEYNSEQDAVIVRPAALDGVVRQAKVVKKYANPRYVETDTLGRVFVGEKGHQVKMSQVIQIKNGALYLG